MDVDLLGSDRSIWVCEFIHLGKMMSLASLPLAAAGGTVCRKRLTLVSPNGKFLCAFAATKSAVAKMRKLNPKLYAAEKATDI